MLQRRLTVLLVALVPTAAASAQLGAPPTWSRTYGGPAPSQGLLDAREMPDGRLVVAGHSGSFGGPTPFNWFLNVAPDTGAVTLQSTSSSAAGGITDGAHIAADGGALFTGRNVIDLFVKHDAWLVRVDASGAVVWTQGFTRPGTGKHFLFDAAELDDGSWIAVGDTSLSDQPPQAAWIVRLARDGSVLWQSEYSGGKVEVARAVAPTADGGFAVAGWSSSSGAGSDDVWVMKIDAGGAIEWQKTFGGADTDQAEGIVALSDGGFAVAASTNSLTASGHAPWILRLAADGSLLWHRVVADDVWGDLGGLAETKGGQLAVVGRVAEPGFPTNDLWCAELDADSGSTIWQRAYEGDEGDFGTVVLPMSGGYLVGGVWGWGFGDESVWLQRTDRNGQIPGCGLVRTTKFSLTRPAFKLAPAKTVRSPGGAQIKDGGAQLAGSAADVVLRCR